MHLQSKFIPNPYFGVTYTKPRLNVRNIAFLVFERDTFPRVDEMVIWATERVLLACWLGRMVSS
jgi:hypothetical protein